MVDDAKNDEHVVTLSWGLINKLLKLTRIVEPSSANVEPKVNVENAKTPFVAKKHSKPLMGAQNDSIALKKYVNTHSS
jgi:hypothetical protein